MSKPLLLSESVLITISKGSGMPYSFRLYPRSVLPWTSFLFLLILVLGAGTVLFFRELELNQHLIEKLTILETDQKLGDTIGSVTSAPTNDVKRATSAIAATRLSGVSSASTSVTSLPKVSELLVQCSDEACDVKLGMITSSAEGAEGSLTLVLETEIPRIGTSVSPEALVRKRYFIYPSGETRDTLSQADIGQLAQKAFRFSRALHTTASFKTGKLQRALVLHAYIFDSNRNLVQHEQKVIQAVQ